ncbi:uncharacterized protein VTP21DRAFT_6125 [Calcarisporiella thermophila]|uniref:uncharacterized protein n=1 Tax=Calcarisporiella thermophila TaxID=911321 RepID=UPI0037428E37
MGDDVKNNPVYEILVKDRFQGQELTERDRELLELEIRLNERVDTKLMASPSRIPMSIFFIIPNEFGERFCFYGIKPLLYLYFIDMCSTTPEYSKMLTHSFIVISYFCPLLGAAISDSYLGKYRTIVYLSVIYFIGTALLTIFSINHVMGDFPNIPIAGPYAALVLMAIGTGGIKPCVSTHGGDQFLPHQKTGIDWFFTVFYTTINVGSLLAQNITPHIKNNIQCFGAPCYFGSYILPSAMFLVALLAFIFGVRYYRIVPPVGEFLPFKAAKVAVLAFGRWLFASREERQHKGGILNFALADVGAPFVEETRLLGRIIYMILPTLFFWMIYDQKSTEWQAQYRMMNQQIGSIKVSPESFGVINSLLIIIMVPSLGFLYPVIEKGLGIRCTTLRRISLGFFLVCMAFLISGLLHISVEANYNPIKENGKVVACPTCVPALWQVPQFFVLSLAEALLSPTGLLFCYQESGKALKAQTSSIWLLMTAFGNIVNTAIAGTAEKTVTGPSKYFMYMGIGLGGWLWFTIQAYFYKYKSEHEQDMAKMVDGSDEHLDEKTELS